MIFLAGEGDGHELTALCRNAPVTGARMLTQLAVYGCDSSHATAWICRGSGGEGLGALLRAGGRMFLAGQFPLSHREEVLDFLQMMGGFGVVEGEPSLCTWLGEALGGYVTAHPVMCCEQVITPATPVGLCTTPPPGDIFTLLTETKPLDWETWYPHVSHLLRHQLGFAAVIYEDGAPAATGGIYATGAGYGVIGGVATSTRYRRRGYASAIVAHLVGMCRERGLVPVLACASDMVPFYAALGFLVIGEWGQLTFQ